MIQVECQTTTTYQHLTWPTELQVLPRKGEDISCDEGPALTVAFVEHRQGRVVLGLVRRG